MGVGKSKGGVFLHDPRQTVAIINLALIIMASLAMIGYSIFDGEPHFLPLIIIALWCLYIQFSIRKKKTVRARWLVKQKSQELAMAVFSILVMSSLIIRPVLEFISFLT